MESKKSTQPLRLQSSEHRVILILGDLLSAGISLVLSLYIWAAGDQWLEFNFEFLRTRPPFWFYLLPLVWLLLIIGLYDIKRAHNLLETIKGIGGATLIYGLIYLIIYFSSSPNSLPRLGVAVFVGLIALLTFLWRFIYIQLFTAPFLQRRVLILGAGKAGQTLVDVVSQQNPAPFKLIGLIDDDPQKNGMKYGDIAVISDSNNLMDTIQKHNISDLILAITGTMKNSMFQSILTAQESGINITTMAHTYEEVLGRVPIFLLESEWIIRSFMVEMPSSNLYRISKRIIDIVGAFIGCVLFVALLPIVTLAILLETGKPIFHRQDRLGRGGIPYTIWKFRTMKKDAEKNGEVMVTKSNDPRITKVGRILRKTHIDEFPQFINVLKGEMSLIGPRAERGELVDKFQKAIPFYRARLLVKPGLSGWAQINQSYAENVSETAVKLEYDLYYIQNRSLLLDIVIMIRTIGTIFGFKGR